MRRSIPQWCFDLLVIVIASLHLWYVIPFGADYINPTAACFAIIGVAALLFRRRYPLLVFLATLPAAVMVVEKVASLFAIYALSYRSRRPWLSFGAVLVLALGFSRADFRVIDHIVYTDSEAVIFGLNSVQIEGLRWFLYYLLMAAAPASLGFLQRTRHDLAARLREITEAREHEQLLLTQQALAVERAQLAREMHDVVSHQVSLIAVQAGAVQVRTKEDETRLAISTIRQLSVKTLDELRHMVTVLRASGSRDTELRPQPTIDQLSELVANSGIIADLRVAAIPEIDLPRQRAIYRTVQEALTNVRKHAPGASASIDLYGDCTQVVVKVVNTASTRPAIQLPSSQSGLLGLRQRAELLGGSLSFGTTKALGWQLWMRLPLRADAT